MTGSPRECDTILANIMCNNNICKLHTPKCNNLQQKNGGRGDVQLGHLAVQRAAPSRLHRRRQRSQRRRPRSCKQRLLRNGPDAEHPHTCQHTAHRSWGRFGVGAAVYP